MVCELFIVESGRKSSKICVQMKMQFKEEDSIALHVQYEKRDRAPDNLIKLI